MYDARDFKTYRRSRQRYFVIREDYIWKETLPKRVQGRLLATSGEFKSSEISLNISKNTHT